MNFLDKHKENLKAFSKQTEKSKMVTPVDIPDGVFVKCDRCEASLYEKVMKKNNYVCPVCQNHFRIDVNTRLKMIVDDESFKELDSSLMSTNPLSMPGYEMKILSAVNKTKRKNAFISGAAKIAGIEVAIGVLDSYFMMGSMGSVVGEKVTRLIEFSIKESLPLIIFSASGGARMQEGIFSLMQMAKTTAALNRLDDSKGLFISVLTHPTTGGVAASFASLGDINIAEKSSLIGFAGPRVIKQTIREELPKGFQTAEFQENHGQVDIVVHRQDLKKTLYNILKLHIGDRS
jgi:acetyl-CoA carboxylase carboxyl transferase subunit beta